MLISLPPEKVRCELCGRDVWVESAASFSSECSAPTCPINAEYRPEPNEFPDPENPPPLFRVSFVTEGEE